MKNSYNPLFLILIGVFVLHLGFVLEAEFFESYMIPHLLIVILPLGVSVYSFGISKLYGGSKVFGRAYFTLGLAFFATFVAEFIYVYFLDILNQEAPVVADYFLIVFYPLLLVHLVINIRYFSDKLSVFQKITIGLVPGLLTLIYTLLVFSKPFDEVSYFLYSLIFVVFSSLQLGLVFVGFSLFRQTVLFGAWLLLLIGIFVGTIGDIAYNYSVIFDNSWIESASALWIGSNIVMLYALYKHQKSI